jgi:hypothetical protein
MGMGGQEIGREKRERERKIDWQRQTERERKAEGDRQDLHTYIRIKIDVRRGGRGGGAVR